MKHKERIIGGIKRQDIDYSPIALNVNHLKKQQENSTINMAVQTVNIGQQQRLIKLCRYLLG